MRKRHKLFVINPGSTSTKIGLFENNRCVFSSNITHKAQELSRFPTINDQFEYRKKTILTEVERQGCSLRGIDAFVGRGGGLVPIVSGTYRVNEIMLQHAREGSKWNTIKHPAGLGPQLVHTFSVEYGGMAFVVNPPDVDEFEDIARITGIKGIYRESRIHALNQKEVAIRYADETGRPYHELNLIIAHIGGGISIAAHQQGKTIDSNDIAQGDGPMTPTRAGSLPVSAVIKLCFSGGYSQKALEELVIKNGGIVSHLGTSDMREVTAWIEKGDKYAKLIYDAMIYQIGKNIGSCGAVLKGRVDAILLTGGIAKDPYLVEAVREYSSWIAPVVVMAGEFEMEALAAGALRVFSRVEQAKEYTGIPVWDCFSFLQAYQ